VPASVAAVQGRENEGVTAGATASLNCGCHCSSTAAACLHRRPIAQEQCDSISTCAPALLRDMRTPT
jgi:hypothetical protein